MRLSVTIRFRVGGGPSQKARPRPPTRASEKRQKQKSVREVSVVLEAGAAER